MMDSNTRDRLIAKETAWANIARRFDAMSYRQRVRAWLEHSALGAVDSAGTEVIERGVGTLTAKLADGSTRHMNAPVPLA